MDDRRQKFGNLLRTFRCSRKLTQVAITDLTGGIISDSQVSRYEHGENLPPAISVVDEIALALGCTVKEKKTLESLYVLAILQPYGIDDLSFITKELAS